jgi:hypothetical protein
MNGDVDDDGWRYSGHFKSKKWISIPSGTSYVRQRRFLRMLTKQINADADESDGSGTVSPVDSGPLDLLSLLERCRIDRERIGVLRTWIEENSAASVVVFELRC